MRITKSPLRHKEGDRTAHSPYVSEEAFHENEGGKVTEDVSPTGHDVMFKGILQNVEESRERQEFIDKLGKYHHDSFINSEKEKEEEIKQKNIEERKAKQLREKIKLNKQREKNKKKGLGYKTDDEVAKELVERQKEEQAESNAELWELLGGDESTINTSESIESQQKKVGENIMLLDPESGEFIKVDYKGKFIPKTKLESDLEKFKKSGLYDEEELLLIEERLASGGTLEVGKDITAPAINLGFGSTPNDHIMADQNPDIPTIILTERDYLIGSQIDGKWTPDILSTTDKGRASLSDKYIAPEGMILEEQIDFRAGELVPAELRDYELMTYIKDENGMYVLRGDDITQEGRDYRYSETMGGFIDFDLVNNYRDFKKEEENKEYEKEYQLFMDKIPSAEQLEEFIGDTGAWKEKNLVEGLNKFWGDKGITRYKAVEAVGGEDAIKIYDQHTLSFSPVIRWGSGWGKTEGERGDATLETASKDILSFVSQGEMEWRVESEEVKETKKHYSKLLTSEEELNKVLEGEELKYIKFEGGEKIIDYANMLNDRVKSKLYSAWTGDYSTTVAYTMEGGVQVRDEDFKDIPLGRSSQQLIIDDIINELVGKQTAIVALSNNTLLLETLDKEGLTFQDIYDNHTAVQIRNLNKKGKDLHLANEKLKDLVTKERNEKGIYYDSEKPSEEIKAQEEKIKTLKNRYSSWWDKKVFTRTHYDRDGETTLTSLIDWKTGKPYDASIKLSEDQEVNGIVMTEEEFNLLNEKEQNEILNKVDKEHTYFSVLESSNQKNIQDIYRLKHEGKKIERVVINNPYVEKYLADMGIYPVNHGSTTGRSSLTKGYDNKGKVVGKIVFEPGMKTNNGLVYDLSVDFIAEHSGRLIRDDGNTWYDNKANLFDSSVGYFGLLKHDEEQEFSWWEKNFFDTDDPRSSLDNYKSASFVNYIDEYRNDVSNAQKKNVIFNKMLLLNIDPGSELQTIQRKVLDVHQHVGEILISGFQDVGVGMGIGEEKSKGMMVSKRSEFDILDQMATEYDIPLSDAQEENIRRSDTYKVVEGVANFMPAIAEFALIEVGLKKVGLITGIPRLITNLTKGYRTLKGGRIGIARMKVLERSYRQKNNIASGVAVQRTTGFDAFMAKRGYKVGLGYNTWGNITNHTYHAIREEFKMYMAFDEDYKMGGGVGFYGTGAIFNKIIPLTKYNQLNKLIQVGKSGTAGMVSVQAAHQLEALVEDLKGNKTFMNAFHEHYTFNEEWENGALVDFFVFGIIGVKGFEKNAWKKTKTLYKLQDKYYKDLNGNRFKNLPTKTVVGPDGKPYKMIDWDGARKNPEKYTGVIDPAREIDKLEYEFNAKTDVLQKLNQRLDIINANRKWQDTEEAKRELDRVASHVPEVLNEISKSKKGKDAVIYEYVATNNKIEKGPAEHRKMTDKDASAQFIVEGKKGQIVINTDLVEPGKLPHEITHFVFKELFKNNPAVAKQFKSMIKDSFKDVRYSMTVKEAFGRFTKEDIGREMEMNIEEMIQNEYGKRVDFDKIEAEEYCAYVAEYLADPINYDRHIAGTVFTDIMQGINRFSNQQTGKNVFGKDLTTKQNIITFLGNFAKSVKSGNVTAKQINMFSDIVDKGEWIEKVDINTKSEGDQAISDVDLSSKDLKKRKEQSKETQDIYTSLYKKAKTEKEKDQIINDYFIGGKNAKKGTDLYEFEIKRQNPKLSREEIQNKNPKKETESNEKYNTRISEILENQNKGYDAKISKLIEKGPKRIQVKGQFDDIVGDAINKLYPDLSYAERQTFFNDIMRDPFKSEGAEARGISGLIKKYRPEEGQNLTQMVREHLVGGGKAGFSRLHEIKGRGREEVFEGFRKTIGVEPGEIKEEKLGYAKQKEVDLGPKKTIRGTINIAENLKVDKEVDIPNINRKAGDVIKRSKLQEMTTQKVGENMMDVTRPIIEKHFNRGEEFYREMNSGKRAKSDEYKKVIAETRNILLRDAKTLYSGLPKQISEMTGEVSGVMKTFGNFFNPSGRRVNWSEMPSWMNLTPSQKARGPHVFDKKPFDISEVRGKKAFLDFVYNNPETGKPRTNAQINTIVEKLIDFNAKSMGAQIAEKLVDQPAYRDMVLAKEGMGKMFDREAENLRFLSEEVQVNRVKDQIRDTLDNALSSKKVKLSTRKDIARNGEAVVDRYVDIVRNSNLEAKEIVNNLSKEYTWLNEPGIKEKILDIDIEHLRATEAMMEYVRAEREFGADVFGELKVGPGGLELFSGFVKGKVGEGYTVNEAVMLLVPHLNKDLIDLRSGEQKLMDPDIANDYLGEGGFLNKLAKRVGLEVVEHSAFRKGMGDGAIRPNFGKWEYRTKPKKAKAIAEEKAKYKADKITKKQLDIAIDEINRSEGGVLIKVNSEKEIPIEFRKPMNSKGVGMRPILLNAKTAKNYTVDYVKNAKKSEIFDTNGEKVDLADVKITNNSEFLKHWHDFVKLVETKNLTGVKLQKAIQKFANEKLSARGDYIATKKANKALLEHYSLAVKEVYNDYVKEGKEELAINMMHLYYQIQTNIGLGPFRGLATHKSGTLEVSQDVRNLSAKEIDQVSKYYRSEHFFQNANLVGNNLLATIKHYNNTPEFLKIHRTASDMFGQAGITKRHQVIVDKNGNTVNIIENPEIGTRVPGEFNIFVDRIAMEKTIDFESGKLFSEIMYPNLSKIKVLDNLKKVIDANSVMSSKNLTKSEIVDKMMIHDKAIELGRKGKKKRKGMSTWDFDDTLAYTKGGVRYTSPNPSGKPQPKKKVIFMAGGPGSGKSNIVKQLGLEKQGFKTVNQDISLEWLMKNHGMPTDMRDFTKEERSTFGKLSHQARGIALRKRMKYQGKGDGVVVDGTGASLKVMENNIKEFTDKGYDVQMVFVETSLETSQARNLARKERSLRTGIVIKTWESVQGNKESFKKMFGERFAEVNTDNLKMGDKMPTELTEKLNDFTKGYIKGRLNAMEYADKGMELKEQGAEFDFTEFDVVTEGEKGPFFDKAMERVEKFGNKHNYILTARPIEAQIPIYEFLKSQGLDIPLENIKCLGNSTGEAKAMWMLEKFAEGYNDMYFADDVVRNVEAVKDVLSQLDVKSKVVQAKIQNDVKNIDRLDSPDTYSHIRSSKKVRLEYEKTITKYRPDLVKEKLVSKTVDEMFKFVDNLNVPINKRKKYQRITTKWLATSNIKLKEDGYKVKDAVELAEKYKEDIFSYTNPNAIIEKYAGKAKAKPTDPKTVKEFGEGKTTNKKHGIVEHEVADTKEGQLAVRKVMDTHFGEKSNPWCLAQKKNGKLTEDSWEAWTRYSEGPKSMVFQNGKLIGFKANEKYWDRMDNATDAPVVRIKDGRVTKTVELVPVGEGKVMETRTVSKDKKTVTTEYHVERSLDPTGLNFHPAGTKIVENKINGITIRETNYKPNGKIRRITEFEKGKEIESRSFMPDGKTTMSINRSKDITVKEQGDFISHEVRDGKIEYWYGETLINGKVTEIGFKTPSGFEVMDVMKRVDGKLRVDLNKLRKIDPDIKGLPKEVVKPEGMRALEPVKKVLDQLDIKSETQQALSSKKVNLSKRFNEILEEVKGVEAFKTYSEGKAKQIGAKKGIWKWWGSSGMEDFQGLITYAFAGKGKQGEGHKKFFEDNLQKPYNRAYNEIHSIKQTMSNDYTALRRTMSGVTKTLNEKIDGIYTVDNAIRAYLWNKAGYKVPGMSKRDLKVLVDFVNKKGNEDVKEFAEGISAITKLKEGYVEPKDYWLGENITADLQKLADGHYRDIALQEFKENRESIFGKWKGGKLTGDNMNKIEAIYGTKHRENIEGMLWAMETGQNRPYGTDAITNKWMNWINNAGGTIMFFNVKSAALQTISNLNYMNGTFNNPLRAGMAFANLPQYIKDFSKIFNSDMLLQRRSGLKINIEASELTNRLSGKSNKAQRTLSYLLEKGFIPTKYADSFAIAMGGATYYRNRIKDLIKRGYSKAEAEKLAWIDFTEITEATQQSSRPDFISAQQRSAVGRPILMFGNTPMQMFRRHKRRIQDISNNRGNMAENILSAAYYGAVQTMIFSYLANAMFAKDEDDLEKEESGFNEKKDARFYETIIDSYLRGMGIMGAVPAALKNGILEFMTQNEKDHNADYDEVIFDLLNVSPPIGSKVRKLSSAGKTWLYNEDVIKEMVFNIDNPSVSATANVISALTNVPLDRLVLKLQNLRDASNNDYKTWERIALGTGVNRWALGLGKLEAVIEAETKVKEKKKIETEIKREEKKKIKLKEKYPDKTDKEIEIEVKSKELFDLSKQEQIDLLKSLDLSDKEIKKLKKEKDRTDKIAELYKDNNKLIDDALETSKTKPKKEKVKKKEVKLSKSEKYKKSLFKMKRQDQINKLLELGYSPRKINSLKYEKDRVEMIIKLEGKKSK